MFKLRKVFDQNLFKSLYRSYVSSININAGKIKSIKIIPDQYENSYQPVFCVEAIDKDKNILKLSDEIVKISQTKDEFNLNWLQDKDDTTIIVEIPVGSGENLEINAKVQRGDIKIDNVPTAEKICASTTGMVRLKGVRANEVEVKANKILLQEVYAVDIQLQEYAKDKGYIIIEQCQANNVRAISENVDIQSLYTNTIEVRTTEDSLLKNLHASNAVVIASGEVLNIVGFSGTFNALCKCKKTMLHFAELRNDSKVKIDHPEGDIQIGFTNEVATETTDIHIHSFCPIETKSKEFVVCQRAESEFEVIRKNADADSTLKIEVKNGREVKLIKQSWIDSIKFEF